MYLCITSPYIGVLAHDGHVVK